MNRRSFITTAGATVAGSILVPSTSRASFAVGLEQAALPYEPAALEPHIDTLTMTIHYGKHHAGYVAKLSDALKAANLQTSNVAELIADINALPADQQTAIRNNGGGHVNHSWFWQWMAPVGSGPAAPEGKLAEAIQTSFGSLDDMKKAFGEAAGKRFGSGWAWLIKKADGKLAVVSTPNQDNPLMKGIVADSDLGTPVLGLDVWEHAYYLHYQNKRPDYIAAWWNVVNWKQAAACFEGS